MVKLKHSELRTIDGLFDMADGYPLNFTNKTLAEFFEDELNEDIYADRFAFKGTSKANRIRAYLELASPMQAGRLLRALWNYKNQEREAEFQRNQQMVASGFMDVEQLEVSQFAFLDQDNEFDGLIAAVEGRSQSEVVSAASILANSFNFDTVAL